MVHFGHRLLSLRVFSDCRQLHPTTGTLNDQNDFKPTVLIPANGELLKELETRWKAQNNSNPFHEAPRPVAKNMLVAIAWAERGKALFPDGRFHWERLEQAMQSGSWDKIDGQKDWGSFDFVMTDPNPLQ
jgi:hypothetical protein